MEVQSGKRPNFWERGSRESRRARFVIHPLCHSTVLAFAQFGIHSFWHSLGLAFTQRLKFLRGVLVVPPLGGISPR